MINRREMLETLAATGIGGTVLHRAIVATTMQDDDITADSIKQAEWITGMELTDEQREEIVRRVKQNRSSLERLREIELDAGTPMAIQFHPTLTQRQTDYLQRDARTTQSIVVSLPSSESEIAFLPVHQLSWLVRTRKLTSLELTQIYLKRLKKYGDMLNCVVTLTEDLALHQARVADEELDRGFYRGPLHGIPWGAKDLIAVPGYPTSWGVPHFKDRERPETATVAARLEQAGAVLCAKLSLGALAQGDQWFQGMTRNPWNPRIGSSGSSAGSAAATIGGLVGFSLGSETLGSIVSPSIRCGASSLRPTFGRVSRFGCMPLSWSLDKIGPICRCLEDCALVFDAIHGRDGVDLTAGSYPFQWPLQMALPGTRIGYTSRRSGDEEREDLKILRQLGCELVEVELPREIPLRALTTIIGVEAASVFDQPLRDGFTEGWNTWDETFRAAQFVSAVDYVRIQRARSIVMQQFAELMQQVDFLVNTNDLLHTNLTGHPSVVLPLNYADNEDGSRRPIPMVLTGHLNDDDRLLALGQAIQQQITAHDQHPDLDPWLDQDLSESNR